MEFIRSLGLLILLFTIAWMMLGRIRGKRTTLWSFPRWLWRIVTAGSWYCCQCFGALHRWLGNVGHANRLVRMTARLLGWIAAGISMLFAVPGTFERWRRWSK